MKARHGARGESDRRYQRRMEMRPLLEPCPSCGKFRYTSRRAARRAMRVAHPGSSMSVYRCGDFWHIGHTPRKIRDGVEERSNVNNTYRGVS